MGFINHDCIVATTWDNESVKSLLNSASKEGITSLCVTPANIFGDITVLLPPDGSKEGWSDSNEGDNFRAKFINILKSFDSEDGSNPFRWVEISFGEFGQKITAGNNRDVHI